ncbi:unnamed protein product [Thelazia callipaeda]|uniref:Centromere protein I n=1 Tax=Thelazia callipaeda TaxID=103827 RepID=A0A0N5CQX6_THECL|nr:unnamed protein product [Thelazia callipaeda]
MWLRVRKSCTKSERSIFGSSGEKMRSERNTAEIKRNLAMERRNSSSNIKSNSPRKHKSFPACVTDILEQVTKVCDQQGQKWRGTASLRNNELQHQLDNSLFCISPDRRISRLNQIQQFRLLQILCDYFKEKESESRGNQYSYFEAIFCGREGEPILHETRISLLINLCSLAVQYPCYSVLKHIAQWLQKIGSGKSYAQQFVSLLVDHYIFIPEDSNLVRRFLYKYLLPLADEVPDFVPYFVVYSVTKDSLRHPLFKVLSHWLKGSRSDSFIACIKGAQFLAKHFTSTSFPCMVVYDCVVGGARENPLHGFITMLYSNWELSIPLEFGPALEILSSTADYSTFNRDTLCYHLHLANLSGIFTEKDLIDALGKSQYSILKSLQHKLLKS